MTLFASVVALLAVSTDIPGKNPPQVLASESSSGANIYAALPKEPAQVSISVKSGDARVNIIKNYLAKYDSPLLPYADYIVHVADENGLDFRLITAIAQQESNLCKKIPEGTFNCWGWGIHSKGTLGFSSYREGILVVSQGLKHDYIDQGYLVVEDIMKKYTPPSKGSWAENVAQFMEDMR